MSEQPEFQRLEARVAEAGWPEQAESTPLLDALAERFGDRLLGRHAWRGDETASVGRNHLRELMQVLRDEAPFHMDYLMDLTVVDYLGESPRFEVVYHLFSLSRNHRLRVKVRVPEDDCRVDSLTSLWASADWMEREAWEFYGVRFEGHPDLRHVLLYPEFEGHPLRKDYPKDGEQPRLQLRDHRSWPQPKPPDVR